MSLSLKCDEAGQAACMNAMATVMARHLTIPLTPSACTRHAMRAAWSALGAVVVISSWGLTGDSTPSSTWCVTQGAVRAHSAQQSEGGRAVM
eukprot:CAMPEP_0202884794 /NCGR_PEP_ID=MMETSP1391-20130828/41333_1 /ASSEMBLY_ACC=CAM_ASM_000867 /TAXON_ID=1034604 /ORGANISM="Chlamydomonas leiostraca, Strain SAG 11-49" /LENGTH=91 /DNA_ID=CAMNT_0049568025 /DNA_START=528 /DNA_END=804 /DNA_ORIENTATION=+